MRHGNKINHLSRTTAHRKALLSNLAKALITHKRITTTLAKAKELRIFVEPLITKAKANTTHTRRMVFAALQDKEAVKELFDNIREKVANRPGGYTRILRMGFRAGDDAEMCIIELVDYNEISVEKAEKAETGRRTRRGRKKAAEETEVVDEQDEQDSTEA
jgi:large subunit ribosomal protein L17